MFWSTAGTSGFHSACPSHRTRNSFALRSIFSPDGALGFVPRHRLRGLCLQATDIDRSWGEGADVRGPLAALLMAACGRVALVHLLDGPGVPMLRVRLTPFRDRP